MDTNQVVLIPDVFDGILYHNDLPDILIVLCEKSMCLKKDYLFNAIFKTCINHKLYRFTLF